MYYYTHDATMDMSEFYNNPEDSDIKIKVGGKIIYAHKIVLKHGSTMFRKGLSCVMKETKDGLFEFPDRNPESIKFVIKWMYGEDARQIIESSVVYFDILSTAHYLQMNKLIDDLIDGPLPQDILISDMICASHKYFLPKLMTRAAMYCNSYDYRSLEEIANDIATVCLDAYEQFRNAWIAEDYLLVTLFRFDCYYTQQNSDEDKDNIELLNRFISSIPFDTFDADTISKIMTFSAVKKCPMLMHLLSCIEKLASPYIPTPPFRKPNLQMPHLELRPHIKGSLPSEFPYRADLNGDDVKNDEWQSEDIGWGEKTINGIMSRIKK